MNPFEAHGIAHLSPSSLNLFATQPSLFVMQKLLGKRGHVGCAAHRGTAAEAGIVHGLLNPDATIEACQALALADYDRLSIMSGDPRRDKERDAVPPIVATAIPELRQYGIPDGVQLRVDRQLEGVPVPLLGYIDVRWSQHGITLDIKSQLRLSSEISDSHARQVSLYVHSTNDEGRIAYCTPNKIGVYRLVDAAKHISDLTNIALRLQAFLSFSADPMVLAAAVVPDLTHYFWSDPHTRAMGREIFGFA